MRDGDLLREISVVRLGVADEADADAAQVAAAKGLPYVKSLMMTPPGPLKVICSPPFESAVPFKNCVSGIDIRAPGASVAPLAKLYSIPVVNAQPVRSIVCTPMFCTSMNSSAGLVAG